MANYNCDVVGIGGTADTGAQVLRWCEVALGGRVAQHLWESPGSPPVGVTMPANFQAKIRDHLAVPLSPLGIASFDADAVYLYEVFDSAQTGITNLAPSLVAYASALAAAENP